MYVNHVPIISEYMKASPEGFARGIAFVILPIRQPILRVPAQMAELFDPQARTSPLFGHKVDAWAYVQEHASELLKRVVEAPRVDIALDALTSVPGLGVVKAAFVLQLMGYDVACLDARNIAREGRNPRAFRSDGARKVTNRNAWLRKIARYLNEVEGRAEEYWNAWCLDAANAYGKTAEEISALHLAIVPEDYVPGF